MPLTDLRPDEVDPHVFCAILAGGAGTRLWPLSVPARPKFLLDLTGQGSSLLVQAHRRARSVAPEDQVYVVTGEGLAGAVAAGLPELARERLVLEPSPRDSSAAIGIAAATALLHDPDAVLVVLPADHVITPEDRLVTAVGAAVRAAADGFVCAIGVRADSPATGYGYVHLGEPLAGREPALRARAFVEKPTAEVAAAYLDGGEHVWNAGIYVARADVVLERLSAHTEGWGAQLTALAGAETLERAAWEAQPRISFDYSVSEPTAALGRVAVVPVELSWRDLGDWASVLEALEAGSAESAGPRVLGDPALVHGDATGLVAHAGARPVLVLGLDDVVVVDAPEGLLVMSLEAAQRLRAAVERLRS